MVVLQQTLTSVKTIGCVLTVAASTRKAPLSATATQDTSARRRAATAKVQITLYFGSVSCNMYVIL